MYQDKQALMDIVSHITLVSILYENPVTVMVIGANCIE